MANAGTMTAKDAAAILGVGVRQVQRLAESGQIATSGVVGRSILLDSSSVQRLATLGTSKGRAWKTSTAWAAMALLDGRGQIGMTNAEKTELYRLRTRLRHLDAEQLVRATRLRAESTRWRVSQSFITELRQQVLLTGTSTLDDQNGNELARLLRLGGVATSGQLDGYVTAEQLARLEQQFFMARDNQGNVSLRIAAHALLDDEHDARVAFPVVALDLAESLDVRERSAGLHALTALLERV
jgi:hypothetical protein